MRFHCVLLALALLSSVGCQTDPAPTSPGDAAVNDAADAGDTGNDTGADGAVVCDPRLHVDCFGGLTCAAGVATRQASSPYDCCTPENCAAAFARNICEVERFACPTGACDARRVACNAVNLAALARRGFGYFDLNLLCAGTGRRVGDRCATDLDCAPQIEGAPGRLRCEADAGVGACVRAARPSVPTGTACVWDDDCAEGDRCDCGDGGVTRVCVPGAGGDGGVGDASASDVSATDATADR